MLAAEQLGIQPRQCVVFEDAVSGIEAAKRAGMYCVGVGNPDLLQNADIVVPSLEAMSLARLDSLTTT
ncbi:Fructose-1-phosphate phosphatase YqaB [compost metagenome]